MSNAFTVDAAFSKAATEFLGDKNSQWGAYKKSAKEIFLHRQKELKETKQKELLKGAQEAALARRDAEIEEDEGIEERLSELRSHYKNISR